jgi:hypothetical protein
MADRIVISVRCQAKNKNGQRCRRHTKRGKECWNHLSINEGLRIKKSNIKNSGMGLFATKPFKKDKLVVKYEGDISDHATGGDYDLEINPNKFIVANKSTSVAGFSNMARKGDGFSNNAKLTTYNGEGRIKSTKPIPTGREILTSYGKSYWKRKKSGEE